MMCVVGLRAVRVCVRVHGWSEPSQPGAVIFLHAEIWQTRVAVCPRWGLQGRVWDLTKALWETA